MSKESKQETAIKCPHCQGVDKPIGSRKIIGVALCAFAAVMVVPLIRGFFQTIKQPNLAPPIIFGAIFFVTLPGYFGFRQFATRCRRCKKRLNASQLPELAKTAVNERETRIKMVLEGKLPPPQTSAVMQTGERALWTEPASLMEEKVVQRGWEGGSRGVRIRVAKGVSVRVGATKGTYTTRKGMVPVSQGNLILTTKRLIFSGTPSTFAIPLDKILTFEASQNIVATAVVGQQKLRIFQLESENASIIERLFNGVITTAITY